MKEGPFWRIAADTGGTFTDCHAWTPEGDERRVKVLSSGVLRATLREVISSQAWRLAWAGEAAANFFTDFQIRVLPDGVTCSISASSATERGELRIDLAPHESPAPTPGATVELFTGEAAPVLGARLLTGARGAIPFPAHQFRLATTRATNALLERKGSPVALFITRGFGELLLIGDQRRKDLFALRHEPREIYYQEVCEVTERLDGHGVVLTHLDSTQLRETARRFMKSGIRVAAVSFLHSDLNPAHEQAAREILIAAGFTHVSLSSELAPFVKILPRAQSAVANAYLTGPVEQFIADVERPLAAGAVTPLHLMTSAGSLEAAQTIRPKDLLLSGPAGGVIGALNAAKRFGIPKIITFDMGGTSTDVARVDGEVSYRFHQNVGGITLLSPAVAIETVAAGGGSICAWTPSGLAVGPHSAGSDPGPACYGKGGPLTITDVNLLLGRFDPTRAPIPLSQAAAEARLQELLHAVKEGSGREMDRNALLEALLALATEHMADAIRKISVLEGYDPASYALLAFGGAGPQHACAVAERLGMTTILAPRNAGILSAVGLQEALPERFAECQVLRLWNEVEQDLSAMVRELTAAAQEQLGGAHPAQLRRWAELRLRGQDTPLQIEFEHTGVLHHEFVRRYTQLYGYPPPPAKPVEVVSLRVSAKALAEDNSRSALPPSGSVPIAGPCLVQDAFSTLIVAEGWIAEEYDGLGWRLTRLNAEPSSAGELSQDILRHRFTSIVDDMGALLRRTALSTNIRERLDFSCALLTPDGVLISSAPHIPVHLGALGECVRQVLQSGALTPGDTIVTNHPAYGGSHLPDVTLITPAYSARGDLLGFLANRAHHAEIGGLSPGSMPANASTLVQEGVVLPPTPLACAGRTDFETLRQLLTSAPYPTRAVEDNLADLHAQLAANRLGVERLIALHESLGTSGGASLAERMEQILQESRHVMRRFIDAVPEGAARERLDDGAVIQVALRKEGEKLLIDFTGTSEQHPGNLNATPAIVRSATLYVLRLALQEDLPLNEGLLTDVEILLPEGSMLHPHFDAHNPHKCPAVVGGNVEVSQRVVDTLIKALGLQACSQGTMNNFLFGNQSFGYYETICGGAGAGQGYAGASALHTHMTNTAITDPEVLERRYPVRVREFSIRRGSGGAGQWPGGDGIVREVEFLEPLTVSLLTQHRVEAPFGLLNGSTGRRGRQTCISPTGNIRELPSSATFEVEAHSRVRIETPGGGGWGAP